MTRPSGLTIYAFLYLAFLYLPVLFLPLFSFNDGTIVAFPIKGWTLEWYRQLGGQETLIQALVNSLLVGFVAAMLATSMGLFAARAYVRYRFRGKDASEGLVMLPLVIPGIIVASSMLVLFISIGIKPSLTAVMLGHTFLALPFSVSIMKSAFDDFDASLEEAAFDLGSAWLRPFAGLLYQSSHPALWPACWSPSPSVLTNLCWRSSYRQPAHTACLHLEPDQVPGETAKYAGAGIALVAGLGGVADRG